jgi:hypothetical protein
LTNRGEILLVIDPGSQLYSLAEGITVVPLTGIATDLLSLIEGGEPAVAQ